MIRAYIAHPFRGDVGKNVEEVTQICRLVKKTPKFLPVSPIHAFSFYTAEDEKEPEIRALILKYSEALLRCCHQLWLTGKWWESEGCLFEVEKAFELKKSVFEFKFTKGRKGYVLKEITYKAYRQKIAPSDVQDTGSSGDGFSSKGNCKVISFQCCKGSTKHCNCDS